MNLFKIFRLIIVSAALISGSSWADEKDNRPLLYAGFAFAGNYDYRNELYPYTSEIVEQYPVGYIDGLIRNKLKNHPGVMRRITLEQGDTNKDLNSVAMALVQESVEIQEIEGKFLVIVLMQANVLAFNAESKSLVASHPIRMRFSRLRNANPSRADIKSIVLEAYTSANPNENILDQWLVKFEKTKFNSGARKYLRINDISFSPEAESLIHLQKVNINAYKNQLGNLLEASIADKSNVPIIPNTVGEAIGNKMPLRFSNAEAFEIDLPDADYAISFLVRGFAATKTESASSFTDIYRTKATITIKLNGYGQENIYFDEQLYDTLFINRPKQSGLRLSDWSQYQKSLQSLVLSLGKQFIAVENEWLENHAAKGIKARPAFDQVKKLFMEIQ